MRLKFSVLPDGTLVSSGKDRSAFLSEFERIKETHPNSFIGIDESTNEFIINKR